MSCGKELSGRSDKKFCDAYCRNKFNNQNKPADEQYMIHVNSKIRKNRRILKTLCPVGKATVRKEVLDQLSYDYQYFSSIHKSKKGVYYLAYDYGFSPITDSMGVKRALIIQRQDYMDRLTLEIWR